MDRRITYFVTCADRTEGGWFVRGEPGLGPPAEGNEFSFVHHQDHGQEDKIRLLIESYDGDSLVLAAKGDIELRPGDILGGEVMQES